MTADEIESVGAELAVFLEEFRDGFGRSEPRTLQEFLAGDDWDEERLQADTYRLVVRDHADDQWIGVIDDSGHSQQGTETAGGQPAVLRQHGEDRQLRDDGASDGDQF